MTSVLVDIQKLEKKFVLGGGFLSGGSRVIHAVDAVDLQIHKGETLGLVGESGCGKSTLAKLLMRLDKPESGQILFRGKDIFAFSPDELKDYRRRVQMVFQDPYSSLNPRKTAIKMIQEPLDIHRIAGRQKNRETAQELMAKVGLNPEQAGRYPHEFSGGQRQRIGIARALALQPELVIADEPVSALDASIQAQILNLLKDLKKDFGLTYLFISHDLNVIRHVSDRIAVMYLGRLVELADKNDLYTNPLHPYTQMLMAAMPSIDAFEKKKDTIIHGEASQADDYGCHFKNRCAYRIDICEKETPLLMPYPEGRFCACHRAGNLK